MLHILLTLAFAANPVSAELPTVSVDVLEIERVYDSNGIHLFDQILARSWEPLTGRHEIRDYRITKQVSDYPRWKDGRYVAPWGGAQQLRQVTAPELVETWHQTDSEVAERRRWSQEARRHLFTDRQPTLAPELEGNDPLPPAPPEGNQ